MRARSERIYATYVALAAVLFAGVISLISGCNSVATGNPDTFTVISAPSGTVRVNQQLQLTSRAQTFQSSLTFYVNGIQGGNAELGTIDNNGLYTAPAIVPVPNTVTITATANGYPNVPPGSLTVGVLNPIPVIGTVTPSGFPEGTVQVTVSGSQFVYGAQIIWNSAAVPTTFNSNNELVAIIPAPNPGTFPLLVSNPNPGSANSATVSVLVAPGQVVLTLQPAQGTDVRVGNPLNIGLMVAGTNNTGVTLAVNGVAGGNAQFGTAVSNTDGSITYTAPLVVPNSNIIAAYPNVVQLTVTSVDNPAVSINQNISVLNPIPILVSATPMSFNVGTASVILQGKDFISGAQVLVNGSPVAATFNSGTQLTANLNLSEPGNLDLQVLNPSPGPATSADLIAHVQRLSARASGYSSGCVAVS